MSKRPAFQFYPGDWRRDLALQGCSLAARGLWIEMMGMMHDGAEYGHLLAGSRPITAERLAGMVGPQDGEDVPALLAELEEAGVFSRTDDGVIYSRRMVKDEDIREKRATAGKKGGKRTAKRLAKANAQANTQSNKPAKDEQTVADEDAVEDSSKETKKEKIRRLFEEFWSRYPKRAGNRKKKDATGKWRARCREGVDPQVMLDAADRYMRFCEETGKLGTEFVMLASTFLNDPGNFDNPWKAPSQPVKYAKAPPPSPGSTAAKVSTEKPKSTAERQTRGLEHVSGEAPDRKAEADRWLEAHKEEAEEMLRQVQEEMEWALANTRNPDVQRGMVTAALRRKALERMDHQEAA